MDYIYIGIGIFTLILNGILVAAYVKLNFPKRKITKARLNQKKKENNEESGNPCAISGTLDIANEEVEKLEVLE